MSEIKIYMTNGKVYLSKHQAEYYGKGNAISELNLCLPESGEVNLSVSDELTRQEDNQFEEQLDTLGECIENLQNMKVPDMVYGDLLKIMIATGREFAVAHYG